MQKKTFKIMGKWSAIPRATCDDGALYSIQEIDILILLDLRKIFSGFDDLKLSLRTVVLYLFHCICKTGLFQVFSMIICSAVHTQFPVYLLLN